MCRFRDTKQPTYIRTKHERSWSQPPQMSAPRDSFISESVEHFLKSLMFPGAEQGDRICSVPIT